MTARSLELTSALSDATARLSVELPPLPTIVRYYDDFANEMRSLNDIQSKNSVDILLDGIHTTIDFRKYRPAELIIKHVFVDFLRRLDPHSVVIRYGSLLSYIERRGVKHLIELLISTPFEARALWNSRVGPDVTAVEAWALKAMLHSLCRLSVGEWSPPAASIVRGLRGPKVDKYGVVRAGDCFLPLDQQALIVNHIDDMRGKLDSDLTSLGHEELRDVCILIMLSTAE